MLAGPEMAITTMAPTARLTMAPLNVWKRLYMMADGAMNAIVTMMFMMAPTQLPEMAAWPTALIRPTMMPGTGP